MTRHDLEIAGKTDPGCVRANNEDSLAVDETIGLLVVADGMGGHNAGEVASALAIDTIRDFARRMLGGKQNMVPEGGSPNLSVRGRQLEYFLKTANTMIYEKGRAFAKDRGMGTTVVAVLADAKSMTVAHVGDSRLYLFRQGELNIMTEDHSLVNDQVRRGLISAEEASKSAMQNILTRALGTEPEVKVDVADHPLLAGDIILLASDGLMKMVSDRAIAQVIASKKEPAAIVTQLIEMARAAGGIDNVTVVVARVPENDAVGSLGGLVSKIFGK